MITTRCPECGEYLKADYRQRARTCRCPFCGAKFVVEALGWWESMGRGQRTAQAEVGQVEERRDLHIRRRARAKSPFEPVDLPEALDLGGEGLSRVTFIGCALGLLLCLAGVAWWLAAPERAREPPKPIRVRPRLAPPRPPVRATVPEKEAPSPLGEEAPLPTAPGPVSRTPIPLPPYAYELAAVIRMAGYEPTAGFRMPEGRGYACGVTGHPSVYFLAHAPNRRVIYEGFLAWPSESEATAPADLRREWTILTRVIGGFLPVDLRDRFSLWARSAFQMGLRLRDSDRAFAREARFGDKVVRCENAPHHLLGEGMSIELAKDYKPSTEIADLPSVRTWDQMRRGVTLTEVEAFAGKGELESHRGVGERAMETYAWPDGHRVTFRNGRAISWSEPAKEKPSP